MEAFLNPLKQSAIALGLVAGCSLGAFAKDLKIPLPARSQLTLVQRLNQEGVDAIRKHHVAKAEGLFYKAYLLDPDDPFTLNNLGYVSEVQSQLDRAQHFYELAGKFPSDAQVERASIAQVKGKPISEIAAIQSGPLRVNQANVEAVRLLGKDRAPEADLLLQKNLQLNPNNAFTLNNLGVAKEMEGEYDDALKYYAAAAETHSRQPAVVTLNGASRGKALSSIAAESAKKVQARIQETRTPEAQAALFNLRGVSAINRNDLQSAGRYFQQAYALQPDDAFSLNNLGYLAELNGDRETAQGFYQKAQQARQSDLRVGLATSDSAQGLRLSAVAGDNDQRVDAKIEQEREARRQLPGPIQLKRRDNTVVEEPPDTASPGDDQSGVGPPQPPIPQPNQ